MTNPGPILDYASPRRRGTFRLPSRSQIRLEWAEEQLTVLETLTGRANAVAAVCFAMVVLAVVAWTELGFVQQCLRSKGDFYFQLTATIIQGVVGLAEAALIPLVIHSNWRRTILQADPQGLGLTFTSPLRTRSYRWDRNQIQGIVVVSTGMASGELPLAEIQLRSEAQIVHLFTDHREDQLNSIAAAIHQALRLSVPQSGEPPATQATTPNPNVQRNSGPASSA